MKQVLLILLFFTISITNYAGNPVWSTDIAPILYNKCAKCHNPQGIGKFSLLTYSDAFTYASSIKNAAVTKGSMPPWPPNSKFSHFKDERLLSGVEKKAIRDWVDGGAVSGDLTKAPSPPTFNGGSQLSKIDLTLKMPTYISQATTNDLYRCFVLDPALLTNKNIEEIEVIPGNIKIAHHVLIYQDTTNVPDNLDVADPGVGYTSFGGIGSNAAELIGAWVPGSSSKKLPYGMASYLNKKSKIIIQIHYPKGTNGAADSTLINIRYSTHLNPRKVYFTSILNEAGIKNYAALIIPKDSVRTFRQEFKIPFQDYSFISIAPHMHLVGTKYTVFAITPLGDTIKGIDIPHWDFHWQDEYTFKKVQRIPVGSTLYGFATYDNTLNNPSNPNNPTKLIVRGEATTDEMMLTFISYMPYQTGDENIVLDSSADINTEIDNSSGILLLNNSTLMNIAPNPVENQLEINIDFDNSGTIKFDVYTTDGKKLNFKSVDKNYVAGGNHFLLNMENLTKGQYILKASDEDHYYTKSFVKL